MPTSVESVSAEKYLSWLDTDMALIPFVVNSISTKLFELLFELKQKFNSIMSQFFLNKNNFSQIDLSYVEYSVTIFLVIAILSIGSLVLFSGPFKEALKKLGK
jgi:hypothetical protein